MKQLSKERLEKIANGGGYNFSEIEEMARALLAGMAQEPVADVVPWSSPNEERTCDIRWRRHDVAPGPLYAAPPAPVVSDAWIPCSERMPEPNVYVLVSNGVWVGQGLHSDGEHLEDDERWQDEHQEFIDLLHHPVTHWQPLPALPRG